MRPQGRTVEHELAKMAARQHGVVTRRQLLAAGISPGELKRRLAKGSLIIEYRAVYRVGHRAPSIEARYLAAVLAAGDAAVLSGRAAGFLLGLLPGSPPRPEVIAPTERRIDGVRTRRCRSIDARDVTTVRGVPVTTVPRTLVDLAAELGTGELARACHEAGVRYRTTPRHVEAVLARRRRARGAKKLRRILEGDARVVLSELERRFLKHLRTAHLPLPQTNRPAGGRVDCRWPEHGLTVELDSYRFHNSRRSWEQDREREREARRRGDEFRRFTWGDVIEEPDYMLGELRALLRPG